MAGLLLGLLSVLVGLPLLLAASYSIGVALVGLVVVVVGIGLVASAPRQEFEVMNSGGGFSPTFADSR